MATKSTTGSFISETEIWRHDACTANVAPTQTNLKDGQLFKSCQVRYKCGESVETPDGASSWQWTPVIGKLVFPVSTPFWEESSTWASRVHRWTNLSLSLIYVHIPQDCISDWFETLIKISFQPKVQLECQELNATLSRHQQLDTNLGLLNASEELFLVTESKKILLKQKHLSSDSAPLASFCNTGQSKTKKGGGLEYHSVKWYGPTHIHYLFHSLTTHVQCHGTASVRPTDS